MKKRINIKSIGYVLMMLTMLLGFSACNNEDDVMEIFNDKTWKLSRITTEKGKEHTISISGKAYGSESDKLAKVFISGLFNVFKYEGDVHNLTLYFKDGNTTKVMGFTAR